MDQLSTAELREQDRTATKQNLENLVAQGTPILAGSNLTIEGATIGSDELHVMRNLVAAIFPSEADRTRVHIELVGKFARKFGMALKATGNPSFAALNEEALEITALGHDFGRSVTHRAIRHDIAGDMLLTQIGMRRDILDTFPSTLSYATSARSFRERFSTEHPNAIPSELDEAFKRLAKQTLEDSSVEQRIIVLSDICGKPNGEGGIRTFEEVMEYHRNSRSNYKAASGLDALYPSDTRIDPDVITFTEHLYRLHKDWLSDQGVDVEKIRQELLFEAAHQH